MMKIISFVGNNGSILERQSQRYSDLLTRMGIRGEVLHCDGEHFAQELKAALDDGGILFGWGIAGVGAHLTLSGENFWEALGIPFISVLADPPYAMPRNHYNDSTFVLNGYIYREWLEFQADHIKSPQISALLPMGVIPNVNRFTTRWSDRPVRMLFVKTGSDPAKQRAQWSSWPPTLQPVLHDCAAALVSRGTGPIVSTVLECLKAHNVLLHGKNNILFGLLHELDNYIRAVRANRMVEAMMPLPVDIIGAGWDHIAETGGRARFHAAVDARELDELYSRTQILVNTTPTFASGSHERVLRGFAARCCILSDNNDHARKELRDLPNYHGVEWHSDRLSDFVANVFHDPKRYDDQLDEALAYVERRHSPAAFLSAMINLAQMPIMGKRMSKYALDVERHAKPD